VRTETGLALELPARRWSIVESFASNIRLQKFRARPA
jgi:hypothetical protein